MKILFAGNKERGLLCLKAVLVAGFEVPVVLAHRVKNGTSSFAEGVRTLGIPVLEPENVNNTNFLQELKSYKTDLTVLAAYGPIVGKEFREISGLGCINLHGGKLPEYRGSSPMNWALMKGDNEIGISIIGVDQGVDTGPLLSEKSIAVGLNTNVTEVQDWANEEFPKMLVEVIQKIEKGTLIERPQRQEGARYFPLRFPNDGLVIWDQLTAMELHNQVRALTPPFPSAFSFFKGKRVNLYKTEFYQGSFFGEPGRIYRIEKNKLLVAAKDQCLWLTDAKFDVDQSDFYKGVQRYESFTTLKEIYLNAVKTP